MTTTDSEPMAVVPYGFDRAMRRDDAEFERFVAQTSQRLLRTAFLLTGDAGHAEDLVQTVYATVAQRWHRVREWERRERYARKVLVNLARARWRRRALHAERLATQETRLARREITGETVLEQAAGDPAPACGSRLGPRQVRRGGPSACEPPATDAAA